MTRALLAACCLSLAPSASAQLAGMPIDVSQFFLSTQTFGTHIYGSGPSGATVFPDLQNPQFTWTGSSPAGPGGGPLPGFDNSLRCDYTQFHSGLQAFAGTSTSMIINTITVPAASGSARVFNGAGLEIGQAGVLLTMIILEVPVDDILAGGSPTMVVAWDNEGSACYPDCNADSALTIADFGCFQSAFVAQEPYADCNQDAVFTIADFGCFQSAFVAGCP